MDSIYIRANVDGKWGSHSLKELFDSENRSQIYNWFIGKVMEDLDMVEGQIITEKNIKDMIRYLENTDHVIVRFKENK